MTKAQGTDKSPYQGQALNDKEKSDKYRKSKSFEVVDKR